MSYSVKSIRKQFAEKGVFYTDEKLAKMLADELRKSPFDIKEVYDPTCGAGNLLAVFSDDVAKFGQEINPEQADVARQRLTNAHIATGDTLVNPAFTDRKFRHIVANYPFSIKWQPAPDARWDDAPTLPPPSKADYAFILHIISMLADDGVAVTLNFPGILYRGNREGKIRECLIRKNLIDSVTLIEGGYFEDTNVATALIVFKKNKSDTNIKFADHEKQLEYTATFAEVEANGFNLSPSSYIIIEEKKKDVDPIALEINARTNVLHQLNAQLAFSKQAIELHSMLGLPPLPPLSEFIKDIMNIVNKYI